jgi:phenylacetate-CoA ligase
MPGREGLYLKLPTSLQHATCSLEGWRIQRSRYSQSFWNLLKTAEDRTYWSEDQMRDFRDQRLSEFVRHCARSVPYYQSLFRSLDIGPEDIRTLDDLRYLPVLTKAQVQTNYPDLLSRDIPESQRIITHTSGTTGGGLRFAITQQATQEQWAIWWRYRRWHGIQPETWCGYFGGRSVVPLSQTAPPFWRYNLPGRQILFSAYHLSSVNLDAYIAELRRRRPPWLHGYPSLLALVAAYLLDTGKDLGYTVQWVTIGAESLLPQQIDLILKAFGVAPIQHYGMAEAICNISECEMGSLHVDEDFAAVEFLANPDGLGYRVIGVNLTNPATPLLRYDSQDIAALSNHPCDCGRPGRVVESIDGRQEDYVILKNGARLGRMDHIFKDMTNINEAQIVQKRPGEMVIRIVRGVHYTELDEYTLLQETRKRVGEQAEIQFDYVESLTRSASGKLRFVVSEIPEGQLNAVYQ